MPREYDKYCFTVKVVQVSDYLDDPDDREMNPEGEYFFRAFNFDHALNQFHESIAIGCLEDFEITIEQTK